ncbi:MAG: phage tail tape measure protein [Pseudomonadota bacterium]
MAIKPIEILIKARDEASSIFGSMQAKVAAVGVAIAGYFGASAFIGAVKGAADLEAKLSEVKAVSNATAAEMVLLRKAAEDAGATTKFTATEGAEALGNLARAGLNAKQAIEALPAVLQLAQAGGIGLAQASEYVTKAVMGMGLAFSDAGRVADVLAAGANASNTSVTGLAEALSYAAPVAKSLGLSLETTVAIIGKFADAGIDASRAGTALNSVLSQFSDPASRFRQELGGAGIITGNFEKALRQLAAAGPAGERAILAVGLEAGPALRALLNQGIGALDDLKGKLDAAKGSAAATAKVMEDNLKGSFNSLSSSWDTVKNTLATPVLPVIRDGVVQLAAALSNAVSNGTIGRFGDAIATAFQGGIKWIKAFAAETDFAALAARMQAFAASTQATFTKLGEYATNAGNTVKVVYGVMASGGNAVLTVIYGLGVAFTGVVAAFQRALALLYEGMAKITFGSISQRYKQMADDVRQSAEATTAASRALADKTIESFNAMGDSAQLARDGWDGLTTSTQAASEQAAAGAAAFGTVATALTAVGDAATGAGEKAQASAAQQQAAVQATRAAVAELKTEYEAALASGNVQLAVEKLKAMQAALKGTAEQAKQSAAEMAKATEDAFTALGITSEAALKRLANTAYLQYQQIKADANSTAVDVANAFKVYAEKAIEANNGVASAALKVEASMVKVSIQTDSTGKTIVSAMAQGAAAIKSVEDAYHQLGLKTPEELKKISDANAAAWDKIKGDSNASVDTLKAAFNTYAQSAIAAAGNVGSEQRRTTEALLQQEGALKGLTVSFDAQGRMVVQTQAEAAAAIGNTTNSLNNQKVALDEVTSAMEAQNAAIKRRNAALEESIALENKRLNRDSEHYSLNTKGDRVQVEGQSQRSVYERAKSQGLNEAQALQIAEQFFRDGQQSGGAGANTSLGENWGTELQKAIDKVVLDNARNKANGEQGGSTFGPRTATTPVTNTSAPAGAAGQVRTQAPAFAPALAAAPTAQPVAQNGGGKSSRGGDVNLTIHVAAGVNMANRSQVESMARAIMPAIDNLRRKGVMGTR